MIPVSINLIPEAPIREIVRLACVAEELGYQRVWVYDEGLATRDVYVTLAAIATATTRIGIGTGITNPYTRHAATTAAAVASVDELSGGRCFLGIGAGGSLTLGPLGVDRSRPLTAVRETIAACRGLFSGSPTTVDGSVVRLYDGRLDYARASTEIWLAGRGSKMLALGGELCDGVNLDFIHKQHLGDSVQTVHNGAERSGNTPRIAYSTMIITSDEAMEQTRPHMTYRLVDSPPAVKELLGITPHDVAGIAGAMANGLTAAGRLVRDEWVIPFVIAGTVGECAAELSAALSTHRMDEFLLPVLDVHRADELMAVVADVAQRGAAVHP